MYDTSIPPYSCPFQYNPEEIAMRNDYPEISEAIIETLIAILLEDEGHTTKQNALRAVEILVQQGYDYTQLVKVFKAHAENLWYFTHDLHNIVDPYALPCGQ